MEICGRRFDTAEPVRLLIEGGVIQSIQPIQSAEPAQSGSLAWIAPGFVDLQVNGYGGQEFNDLDLDLEKVLSVSQAMDADGVTSYCPTTTTHSRQMLTHSMRTLAQACNESDQVARRVCGIHLEGPYISCEEGPRGAHPLEHCRPPDWDEFCGLQEAADGRIVILTLSPEYPESPAFIKRVVDSGVLVAIGHTAADSEQIEAAVDAGASMSTHLGNGAHGQIRRHPNYIWDQLGDDRLVASLITDGHHLPPSVVKSFVRAKTIERCVLVSDLVGMAGMPAGRYRNTSVGDIDVLEDGRVTVAGQQQYLAGAGLPITYCIANVMRFANLDLKSAVEMASQRPASLIGLTPGELVVGAVADLVLFDMPDQVAHPLAVRATYNRGERVHQARDLDG